MRVLDLSHVMAGPVCGLMLADMGAEVIKVEKIDGGDDTRRMLPPDINGEPAAFMMMNRNKRGIALDLKHPRGKEVLKKLVAKADALIENYRHDTMQRLGLGYEALRDINPGLIYCEISGFGRSGPWAEQGGFDLVAQGMSGLMAITGEGPGRAPVKVGAPVTDITAGILAAMGVCAAYAHKLKTGEGQRVDTSLFEAGITHTYWQSAIAFATGVSPGPLGSAHPLSAPYQAFPTKDGWINLGASNQRLWLKFVELLDDPELAADPRFKDNAGRMGNLPALVEALTVHFKKRTTAEWLDLLEKAGIPAGPVLSIREMHAHPQTIAREMVPELEHPVAGKVQTIGLPVKFSKTPGKVAAPAPLHGQHTREVLAELGYGEAEIDSLIAERAVGTAPGH
ncbi:MAG TPA: CoA transferase [Hyphomicrobiaceae bacterium]|jgi:crotonobetainyl-CoA:carnitine CoA-transferase CaiB-like acyl-CoA transferase